MTTFVLMMPGNTNLVPNREPTTTQPPRSLWKKVVQLAASAPALAPVHESDPDLSSWETPILAGGS
jgi:hypothetical protein